VRTTYVVTEESLERLLGSLDATHVYATIYRGGSAYFADLRKIADGKLAFRHARPSASPKSFLQPAKERVAVYTSGGMSEAESAPAAERHVLLGVRACDLKAIAYLDKVFLEGEFRDPFYEARRQSQVLISVDCVTPHEACFCTAIGGLPYAESGFDLNLSPLASGYLVEVGSAKGRAIIEKAGNLVRDAAADETAERQALRKRAVEAIDKQTGGLRVADAETIQQNLAARQKAGKGLEFGGDCVECAACTFICPTCYCFYLYDQSAGADKFERLRTWDSCLLGDYSRMAGPAGAKPSPRPRLRSRFANRLLHKYAFGPQQFGAVGCVGCGRCIEACFGKIDMRQVLRELSGDASR
jgi:sulfhydrogenase subunit beta (sulfur reductase)